MTLAHGAGAGVVLELAVVVVPLAYSGSSHGGLDDRDSQMTKTPNHWIPVEG